MTIITLEYEVAKDTIWIIEGEVELDGFQPSEPIESLCERLETGRNNEVEIGEGDHGTYVYYKDANELQCNGRHWGWFREHTLLELLRNIKRVETE